MQAMRESVRSKYDLMRQELQKLNKSVTSKIEKAEIVETLKCSITAAWCAAAPASQPMHQGCLPRT